VANAAKPLKELLADVQWLIDKGRGEEPSVLYMPKLEARRRAANTEGRVRVQFYTDPETYSLWNAERDRWVELCGNNPTIAYPLMLKCLSRFNDDFIRKMMELGHEG
jgi:hypothetical protein